MGMWLPIEELAAKVQSKELTAVSLVEKSLAAIEQHKEFNAIVATTEERARLRAASYCSFTCVGARWM